MGEDIVAVQPLVGQIAELVIKTGNAPRGQFTGQIPSEAVIQKPRGDKFPFGRFRRRQLDRRLDQRGAALRIAHRRLGKAVEFGLKCGQRIAFLTKILLYAAEKRIEVFIPAHGLNN